MTAYLKRRTFSGWIITAFVLLILFLATLQIEVELGILTITLQSFLLWLILLWGVIRCAHQQGKLRFIQPPFFYLWLVYVCLRLVSFALGEGNIAGPLQALWSLFRHVELLLLYPIILQMAVEAKKRKIFLFAIAAGLGVAALIGIAQTMSGGQWFTGLNGSDRYLGLFQREYLDLRDRFVIQAWNREAPFFRAQGPASSPNAFGALMNTGLAIAVGMLWSKQRQKHVWVLLLILTTIGLFLSFSRAAWVSMCVALLSSWAILNAVRWQHLWRILWKAGLLAGILAISYQYLPYLVRKRIETIWQFGEVSEIISRQEVWSIAWQRICEQPLIGYGTDRIPGTLLQTWGEWTKDVSPHSIYLAAMYQSGVLFLGVLVVLLIVLVYSGYQMTKSASLFDRGLGIANLIFSIAITVHGFFDSILQPPSMQILFWSMFCLSVSTQLKIVSDVRLANALSAPIKTG